MRVSEKIVNESISSRTLRPNDLGVFAYVLLEVTMVKKG